MILSGHLLDGVLARLPRVFAPSAGPARLAHGIPRAVFGFSVLLVGVLGCVSLLTQFMNIRDNAESAHVTTLRVLETDLRYQLDSIGDELKFLSQSPLVWTAISDSEGRESYLKPYMRSQSALNRLTRMTLLDYRGRYIAGVRNRLDPAGDADLRAAMEQASTRARPVGRIAARGERLILAFPVLFPYSQDVIGILLAEVRLAELLGQRVRGLGENHGVALHDARGELLVLPDAGSPRHLSRRMVLASKEIDGLYRFELEMFARDLRWFTPALWLLAVYLTVAAVLIGFIRAVSRHLATRLTRRLERLTESVLRGDELVEAVETSQRDEISTLTHVLNSSLRARRELTDHLEEQVQQRTAELAEREAQYRLLAESMKDVVWTLDTETLHFSYVSPSVERLRGFSVEEILAAPLDAAMTPEAAAAMQSLIRERAAALLSGETPSEHFYTNQVEQPCKDGGSVWTEVITRYRVDEKSGHVVVLGVTRDISERLHGEELERYSAFQAGIAENSVSVLHNVGNAITSVLMDAKALRGAASDLTQLAEMLAADLEAVRARLGSAEPGRAEVERLLAIEQEAMMVIRRLAADGLMARSQRIGDSVERIAEMVSLRQDAVTPGAAGAAGEACDLGQLLRDALAMRQDGLTRLGIEVEVNLDAGLARVALSRNRLLQALLHVLGNAQEAIETRQAIEAGAGRILIRGEALDTAFFRLTLSDNGIGIDSDPAARAKLFESGYTTKPRGTGYGLHAAALFAREVGGSVSLDSPGRMRGATLTLVLPFAPASGIADAAAASLSGSMQ
jgi:PAS domain S-box-containing protein